ncbi:MAG: CPBP family intramembrane metalloprotease [Oscillospiraceae bacterium]|nr:CPBP family intramembrane metalloprotease [Oscillospiraceae bacterium]
MREIPGDTDNTLNNDLNRHTADRPETSDGSLTCPGDLPEGGLPRIRRSFSRLGFGLLLMHAVSLVGQVVLSAILNVFFPGWSSVQWLVWTVPFVPMYLIGLPLAVRVMRKVPAYAPGKQSISAGEFIVIAVVCVFMMYAGNVVGLMVNSLINSFKAEVAADPVTELLSGDNSAAKIIVAVVIGPLVEEFVFRRLLIDRMRIYGERMAVFTTAALFGLYHGNFTQMFYAFALGLVFGYVYIRTGRLRFSAGLHIAVNFFGAVVAPELLRHADIPSIQDALTLGPDALLDTITPWTAAYAAYAFLIFGLSVTGLVLLCVYRKRICFGSARWELEAGTRFKTVWINAGMALAVLFCLALTVVNSVL